MSEDRKVKFEKHIITGFRIILIVCVIWLAWEQMRNDSARDAVETIDAPVGIEKPQTVIDEIDNRLGVLERVKPVYSSTQEGWIMLDSEAGVWIEWGNGKLTLHNALAWDWEFNAELEQYEFSYERAE